MKKWPWMSRVIVWQKGNGCTMFSVKLLINRASEQILISPDGFLTHSAGETYGVGTVSFDKIPASSIALTCLFMSSVWCGEHFRAATRGNSRVESFSFMSSGGTFAAPAMPA